MSEKSTSPELIQWGIVELMGHKTVAGEISTSEILGKPLLRVDIPAIGNNPPFTQMFGESAIYCITFVNEDIARNAAAALRNVPIIPYSTSALQLNEPDEEDPDE